MTRTDDAKDALGVIDNKIAALPANSKRRALQVGRKETLVEIPPVLEPDGLGERALKKVEADRAAKKALTKQLTQKGGPKRGKKRK